MVQMKKSKDANVGYAFIKFEDKEVERMLLKEKHNIDGKQVSYSWMCLDINFDINITKAYLRIPNSQQGDRSERKVYVSYHTQDLTKEDLRSHFEKFGDVEDVFIPAPWRHFCFVTFMEKRVAQALLGKEHTLKVSSGDDLVAGDCTDIAGGQPPDQEPVQQQGEGGRQD